MVNLKAIWYRVLKDTSVEHSSIHGPDHWARVERNGLYVAQKTGADTTIVQLFAVFHDCMRWNDHVDPGHGCRGAEYAARIKNGFINISSNDFDKFYYACEWHTDQIKTDDVTIAACWDADRLDIGRVGYILDYRFMNSQSAQEIAKRDDLGVLEHIEVRNWMEY